MEHLCPSPMKAMSNGIFQGDNPLDFALPFAILQICLVLVVTRGLAFLLWPLQQPRVIAEIIGRVLLGPSALGRNKGYLNAIFPPKSITFLDTLSNIGLFFLFLACLELDVKSLRQSGKKVLAIAVAGISLPFALGSGSSFILRETIAKAAAVNNVAAWILLALAIALSGDNLSPVVSLWWILRRCHEGEPVEEIYICGTLAAILAAGLVTDIIGIHAMFGAFVVGVLVPKEGPFAGVLVQKVEDLVSVSLLWKIPKNEALALRFLMKSKGLVELMSSILVLNDQTFAIMVMMALVTTFITTPLVLAVYKPAKMLSKGDYKHKRMERKNPNTQLRILTCFRSSRNIPLIINLLEASRGTERGERLCVYANAMHLMEFSGRPSRNIPLIINLLEASRGTERGERLCVYANAMHLMEFSERPSVILMVHKARHNGLPFWNKGQRSANQVVVAFESFQQLSQVSVRRMTSISSLSDMHEDICITAEKKNIPIIILPYHKNLRFDGSFESTRPDFHLVNKRVLEHASCSVGIFVDRGLGGSAQISGSNVSFSITVLFFGGHDDREALSYGARMAEHPGVELTVIRFLVELDSSEEIVRIDTEGTPAATLVSADEEFLAAFRTSISEDSSVKYEEKNVRDVSETITILRDYSRCSLFLVGRTPNSVVALALSQRIDCPELGWEFVDFTGILDNSISAGSATVL
ncbi:hypothetical protein RND71_026771 [Anisodus tanguticus]|uniref:Cation/H+ exchanger domain-containing protein n=1 Tax=Anisodus tanguticus TaxID=243964 RepID=A0AAE1V420_9SOLA|nr:hypothetical protein RND71_026771 [Anisodus tanguticus]